MQEDSSRREVDWVQTEVGLQVGIPVPVVVGDAHAVADGSGLRRTGTSSWILGSDSGYCVDLVVIGLSTQGIVVPLRELCSSELRGVGHATGSESAERVD